MHFILIIITFNYNQINSFNNNRKLAAADNITITDTGGRPCWIPTQCLDVDSIYGTTSKNWTIGNYYSREKKNNHGNV